ncbi:MAG: hypothetical protein HY811_01310 [Planctomycetes bacterium]|nr:hypothetical protein [Planctomycetota bacterium]
MSQNVSEIEFKQYLETYHKTLEETVNKFLPKEYVTKLWSFAIQPSHIIGYLSTNFGIGYEYVPGKNDIQIVRGSSRIEDLFLKTTKQIRNIKSRGIVAYGSGTIILDSGQFKNIYPFSLESLNARIRIFNTTCEALNWKRYIALGEIFGNRKKDFWTTELAITRAKDEILIALTDISQTKKYQVSIDDFVKQRKAETILIIGDYSREQRLREIAAALSKRYTPILVKDIPDSLYQDIRQKAITIGSVSRFVIVEDSSPSGHLRELDDCKNNDWITVILREQGQKSTFMTAGISNTSTIMKEFEYTTDSLNNVIENAIKWAEETIVTRKKQMIAQYPWRL